MSLQLIDPTSFGSSRLHDILRPCGLSIEWEVHAPEGPPHEPRHRVTAKVTGDALEEPIYSTATGSKIARAKHEAAGQLCTHPSIVLLFFSKCPPRPLNSHKENSNNHLGRLEQVLNRARNWAMHLPTFSPRHFIAEYIVQTRGSSHCPVFFTQVTIPLPGCDEDDGDLVAYALGHSKVKSKHEAARLAMLDPRMSMYVRQFHGRKRPHATLLHEALLQAALPRLQAERPDLAAVVAPQFVLPPPEYPQIPRIPQPPSCPPPANVVRSPKLEPSSSPAGVPRSPQPPPHSPSVGAVRGPQPPPYPPPAGAVRGPQPPPYPPPAGVARGPRPPPYPPPAHLAQPAPLLLTAPPSATPPMPQAPPPSPADSSPSPPSSPQPGGHGLASDSTGAEDSHGYSPQPAGAAERAALRALGATVGCKTEPREPSPEPDSPPVINVRGVVYTADGAAPAKRQRVHPAQAPASVAAAAAAAAPGITTCVVKVEPDSDDDNHIGAVLLGLGEYMDSEMQSRTSPCALLMPPAPPQPSQTPTRSLRPAARAAAARPSPTSL